MDFTDRNMRSPQQTNNANLNAPVPGPGSGKKAGRFHRIKEHRLLNITYLTLLFSITVLIVGVVILLALFNGNRDKESQFVDTSKYQAVFLNGGQVYFGKVTNLNHEYLTLTDIYYLTPNQAVQTGKNTTSSNNFTIRKLGCELHRPQDGMIIDHSQIVFWENLKDDSSENTVPGAIKKLSSQPQNCDAQTTSNGSTTDTSNTTTPATTTPANGNSSDNSSLPNNSNTTNQ
ncbi:MAG TPA: hypothetical protein VFW77_03205 [Candidatus Saccharimonadales bacterium]|nr:hypothetical protein [Candidatus Saccharimonadales bacterium]